MSRRSKEDPCPVEGCDYRGLPGRVKQHVERKRDEAHEAHRRASGIEGPAAKPLPGGEEEERASEPASPPARREESEASEIEVDFGGRAPVVEPLVREAVAPASRPVVVDEASDPGPAPASEPGSDPASDGEEEAMAAHLVVDEVPPAAGAAAAREVPSHGSAMQVPTLGQAALSPFVADLINRCVRGATNRWLIDEEKGDRPLSMEAVQALQTPELVAETLNWLEREYGFRVDLNHPIAWWLMAGANFAAELRKHRAPRERSAPGVEASDEVDEREAREEPEARSVPVEPAGPYASQLEGMLGG